MLRILLHVLVLPVMLWLDKRYGAHLRPSRAAAIWYLLGVPLAAVEAAASPGPDRLSLFLQDVLVAAFYIPPAYCAFRHARKDGNIGKAFGLYLLLALIASVVAALALAQAPIVRGFLGTI